MVAKKYPSVKKDILIVIKDQLDCIRNCVDSIYQYTKDFNLYLWDNGSRPDTADYLRELSKRDEVTLHRVKTNKGFIVPNNRLAGMGHSPFIILLNSDTIVREGWDRAMTGWLQQETGVAEVGYLGGFVDENGRGYTYGFGSKVDYICGWSLAIRRQTYEDHGLFDEKNLKFAYCEDSDLSFRLRENGYGVYALHVDLVTHLENQTVKEIIKEGSLPNFDGNYDYIRSRWKKYLNHSASLDCGSEEASE